MNSRADVLELLGAVAVAFDEGARLGTVSDIYVDRKECRLKGVAITTRMPSGYESPSYVDYKHVRVLGEDVMVVANQRAVTTPLPKGIEETSLKRLKHLDVVSRDGSHLGRLVDVSVDVSSGKISQLMLAEREYLDIDGRTTALGADVIVLPSQVKKKTRKVVPVEASAKRADSVMARLGSGVSKALDTAKKAAEKIIAPAKETDGRGRDAAKPSRK